MHAVEPAAEEEPAGHAVHASAAPASPLPHVLALQAHEAEPAVELAPTGQATHVAPPAPATVKVLAAQGAQ